MPKHKPGAVIALPSDGRYQARSSWCGYDQPRWQLFFAGQYIAGQGEPTRFAASAIVRLVSMKAIVGGAVPVVAE